MPRSLTRLYLGGSPRKNGRPGTSTRDGNGVKASSEMNRDSSILRKRKVSSVTSVPVPKPATVTPLQPAAKVALKPGLSVLDQIGRPDHAGWLRKKGVRYNTWKLRYLVLKGPHLYYLRSNGRSVSLRHKLFLGGLTNIGCGCVGDKDQRIHQCARVQSNRRRECEPWKIWL